MKIGKVPEAVLKRSVMKQITCKRPEVLVGASIGEDCGVLKLAEDEVFVVSTDPITGAAQDIGHLAVHITANDLASSGAEPVGILLTVLLPENSEEAVLKEIMSEVSDVCAQLDIQIVGGHTEVTAVVNQPLVSVTGIGKMKETKLVTTNGVRPGMDILVTKWIGLEGTSIIAKEKEEQLAEKLPHNLIDTAKNFDRYLSVVPEAKIAMEYDVAAMHDVTEGGIFGALWEIAEASGVGLEVDLRAIPVRQETIEVCECFQVNPYMLISSGSMLMAAPNGHDLVRALRQAGIEAAVIGKAMEGNDRVILNEEERRFLEPPKTDELYKVV